MDLNNLRNKEKRSIRCVYENQKHQYVIHVPNKLITKFISNKENPTEENIFTLCISEDCYKHNRKENCDKEVHVVRWYIEFVQVVGCHNNLNGKEIDTSDYYNQYVKRNREDTKIIIYDKNYAFKLYDEKGKLHEIRLGDIDITLGFHEYIYYYREEDSSYGRRICKLYEETKGRCKFGWNCLDVHFIKKDRNKVGQNKQVIGSMIKENTIVSRGNHNTVISKLYVDIVSNNNNKSLSDKTDIEKNVKVNNDFIQNKNKEHIQKLGNTEKKKDIFSKNGQTENKNNVENDKNKILNHNKKKEKKNAENENDIVIDLNVGGILYQTLLSTLRKCPTSKLNDIFSEEHLQNLPKDQNGRYFLDRDGHTFYYVLEYLRNGNYQEKKHINFENIVNPLKSYANDHHYDMEKIKKEFHYFGLISNKTTNRKTKK